MCAECKEKISYAKGRLWQHNLDLVVPAGSTAPPADLSRGRYLVRIYVDKDNALAKDWTRELRRREYLAGEVEVPSGWSPGYGQMKRVSIPPSPR